MMNPLPLVVADVRKHLASSLSIVVLLAIAVSGTVMVNLFERALINAGVSAADNTDLVIGAPGSQMQLVMSTVFLHTKEPLPLIPVAVADRLTKDSRVAASAELLIADQYRGAPIVGVGAQFAELRPDLKLMEGRWAQSLFEVVAGADTQLAIGQAFHSAHGLVHFENMEEEKHTHAEYKVVGRLAASGTPWDRALMTPIQSIWDMHGQAGSEPEHEVSAVLVKPRTFADAYELRAQYQNNETISAFPGEVLASLFGLFDSVKKALTFLAILFQVIVLAAAVLSLLAALPSKTRWIGLLRSLGAGRGFVFLVLWCQAAVFFLIAGLAGLAMGWVGTELLSSYVEQRTSLSMKAGLELADLIPILLFWLVGLLGALVPAFLGYRQSARAALQAA
jgi:putative ABC transport system permease protein